METAEASVINPIQTGFFLVGGGGFASTDLDVYNFV